MTETMTDLAAPKTYKVPEVKIADLTKRLDKMIKKATRLGIETCSYTLGAAIDVAYETYYSVDKGCYTRTRFQGDAGDLKLAERQGHITYSRFIEVTIAGPNPVLGGWEFVATLEHLTDDQGKPMNMLMVRPGFEGKLPERFHTVIASNCDHCHQTRNRTNTYVVRNVASGEWKQIGSSCIKDFCGGNDPRAVAAMLEWWLDTQRDCQDEGEQGEGGGREASRYSLRYFLAVTAAAIREDGWMSRSKADEACKRATVETVLEALNDPKKYLIDNSTQGKADAAQAARLEASSSLSEDKREQACDDRAAAAFEEAAYGRD